MGRLRQLLYSVLLLGLAYGAESAETALSRDLYAVTVNGQVVSDGMLILREADGGILLPEEDIRNWRLLPVGNEGVTIDGRRYFPMKAFPGLSAETDAASQTLQLHAPAGLFETTAIGPRQAARPFPVTSTGVLFNYDLSGQSVEQGPDYVSGLFEAGAFNRYGVAYTSFVTRDMGRRNESTRLETQLISDDVERRRSVRFGDSISRGGSMGRPLRFGGAQIATNFSTQPGFITYPSPPFIGGLAETSSVVDVYVNNVRSSSEQVPVGPFEVRNIPVTSGSGDITLTVRDILGREQVISYSYYLNTSLLKQGLADYSYEAGYERLFYSQVSNDYGKALVSGTHRYGITDRLTGELHAEAMERQRLAAAEATLLLAPLGTVSAGFGSSDVPGGPGRQRLMGIDHSGRVFSFGTSIRTSTPNYRSIGTETPPPTTMRQTVAYAGLGLQKLGSIRITSVRQTMFTGELIETRTGAYSAQLGPGFLSISAYETIGTTRTYGAAIFYVIMLGPRNSLMVKGNIQANADRYGMELHQGLPLSQLGYAYRLSAEKGEAEYERIQAQITAQGEHGNVVVEGVRDHDRTFSRMNVSGSLVAMENRLYATRRIFQSFGLVEVPGHSKVRVSANNLEAGRTDSDGRVLVPSLQPYMANKISVDESDLPIESTIGGTELVVAPYFRSGAYVRFPISPGRGATITLIGKDIKPLPAGSRIQRADGTGEWFVGMNGQAYLTALSAGPADFTVDFGAHRCGFSIDVPVDLSGVPDLGVVRCE